MTGKLEVYVTLLKSGDAAERWEAASILSAEGRDLPGGALGPLGEALDDPHPFVRWYAGIALAHSGRGLSVLVRVIREGSDRAKAAAVDAIAVLPDPSTWQEIAPLMESGDPLVRQSCADALGRMGQKEATPYLLRALSDRSEWVRRAAARALGHTGDTRAFLPLCERLSDGGETALVKRSAAYALGALRSEVAVGYLVRALDNDDPQVRLNAAWALGRVGGESELPQLRRLLEDDALDGGVAEAARRAISEIRPSPLKKLLGLFRRRRAG